MFDLTIYPLHLIAGREQHELPGLLASAAPRKAARMRAQDLLLLSLSFQVTAVAGAAGGPRYTPAQQQEMLRKLAETYFSFSGSVTAGLKAVAARLNDFLLARNLKSAHEGQATGILNMAVVRGSTLILAHAGPTHSFLLGKQVQHFDDSLAAGAGAGRGLGLSRQAIPRFYQATVEPGDVLILCAAPPPSWNAHAFIAGPQHHFDLLRRRLLSDAADDLQAAVVRFQPGKGQIGYWRPPARPAHPAPPETAPAPQPEASLPPQPEAVPPDLPAQAPSPQAEAAAPALTEPVPTAQPETGLPPEPEPALTPPPEQAPQPEAAQPQVAQTLPARTPVGAGMSPRPGRAQPQPVPTGGARRPMARPASTAAEPAKAEPARPRQPREPVIAPALARFRATIRAAWMRGQPGRARIQQQMAAALRRAAPRRVDEAGRLVPLFNFTTGTMLAVAIFVPLVVVAVAMAVYLQVGRSEQYQIIFQQAQLYAAQAAQQTDPNLQREAWTQAYELVRRAEQLQRTDESRALFQQAQDALDNLEGYVRLDYSPAVRAFPADVNITRIVATLNDVYLLDSSVGRILRLYRTATGYEVDANFNCGPGQAGSLIISELVDVAALPPANEARAAVVGIDKTGNLVYCAPNMSGFSGSALALPDLFWGEIRAMRLSGDILYVLDPVNNAVYYYDGEGGRFNDKPHLFFDEEIPHMADVIDIAVDQEFLYLLHADGQMTICEGGGISLVSTRCTDTPYGDPRPGYDPAPLAFEGVRFSQIQATQPPDPSLFALDGENHAIYHLSLRRLNLQRQFRPRVDTDFPLPSEPATAFAIAPNRRALIAFGNEVFFAPAP